MRKIRTFLLPGAGKPEGQCPDCGPHGNRGLITLLFGTAPCVACETRADARAREEGARAAAEIGAGMTEPRVSTTVELVEGQPWARRVRVEVEADNEGKLESVFNSMPGIDAGRLYSFLGGNKVAP